MMQIGAAVRGASEPPAWSNSSAESISPSHAKPSRSKGFTPRHKDGFVGRGKALHERIDLVEYGTGAADLCGR